MVKCHGVSTLKLVKGVLVGVRAFFAPALTFWLSPLNQGLIFHQQGGKWRFQYLDFTY
jgi:hypothetical protein